MGWQERAVVVVGHVHLLGWLRDDEEIPDQHPVIITHVHLVQMYARKFRMPVNLY